MLYFVIFIMLNRVDNHIYVKYNTDIKNRDIIMKSSRLFVYSLLPFMLAGCGQQPVTPSSSTEPSSSTDPDNIVIDGITFNRKKMTAYLHSPDVKTLIDAYFREDGLKNIPYVKLSDFYSKHVGKFFINVDEYNGKYTYTSAAGGAAAIDTKKDTLASLDFQQFINTSIYRQDNIRNVYYDGSPFVRVKSTTTDVSPSPTVISFKKYGIDLFSLDNDVLLPITLASNLFQGPTMLTCFYSGDNIYFIDPNDPTYNTETVVMMDETYREGLEGYFSNGKRSKEQAEYSYGELCFYLDTYYGRPGRETLHKTLEDYKSLDAALAAYDDITRQARIWLKSTDQCEYIAGLYLLDDYLSDTGHTIINFGAMMYANSHEDVYNKIDELFTSINYTPKQNAAKREYKTIEGYSEAFEEARNEKEIKDKKALIEGDTLLYTFNAFAYDDAGWRSYISKESSEMPHDQIGEFVRLLEEYKDGSTIKNICIDLSDNGGGSGDVVFTFMALMGKEPYLNYYDCINKNYVHVEYEVDKNFDGKFDEEDKKLVYPYNFAILSSNFSFSCGNILPVQAKESGILLLGDKSGGGACAVFDGVVAEGYYARIGGSVRLVDKEKNVIDFGVEPNIYTYHNDQGVIDLSEFYDLSAIKKHMDEFYK